MPHRSRLAGFIIDCQDARLDEAARFWAEALGLAIVNPDELGEGKYAVLSNGPGGLHVEVQRVAHESRVHLDIEADDIEAEVRRLEALGAAVVTRPEHGRWVVMQAPTGQRYCVVRWIDAAPRNDANDWP
jgi:predicted enzyme related to lactoylglutathione lyase